MSQSLDASESFGKYTAIRGKLAPDDSRKAYVTGPTITGRIAPLASFWTYEEAVAAAKKLGNEDRPLRLCYVRGCWAYFSKHDPIEVWGDDWNDAPYQHNAGEPSSVHGKDPRATLHTVKVAFDANFMAPCETSDGWTVEMINRREAPWLENTIDDVRIYAGATFEEFCAVIKMHGGAVYVDNAWGERTSL